VRSELWLGSWPRAGDGPSRAVMGAAALFGLVGEEGRVAVDQIMGGPD
jgi:hypothetical protein